MDILDNELVKKYFRCKECSVCRDWPVQGIAWHVLISMQEPIKKGERYLCIKFNGDIVEESCFAVVFYPHWHCLRLPDRFQKEEKKECDHPYRALRYDTSGTRCMDCMQTMNSDSLKSETEKCTHNYGAMGVGCMPGSGCKGRFIIKDEVEEKIKVILREIITPHYNSSFDIERELRELVELARGK